jgi:hypothetical protein
MTGRRVEPPSSAAGICDRFIESRFIESRR